jgi:peptidyl-prolyl cis-trans isomerase A (cyclophilin A)
MRAISLLLCLLLAPHFAAAQDSDAPPPSSAPRARVVTNAGNFVIELDPLRAPKTVEAFLKYAKSDFYNGVIFHRVVAGFIAQAGGYTADLQQKPVTEAVFNESGNGLSNLRGTVGFARSNEPHSGTSQFYINLADNIDLNPRPTRWGYAVFGKIVEGMEVADDIGHRPTAGGGPFDRSVPVDPITIERIEVLE